MSSLRAIWIRFCNLFRQKQLDQDFVSELAAHLELHVADNVRAGMSPAEARRHALLKLGGLQQSKENYREQAGIPFLQESLQDFRYAVRKLLKSPGFTLVVVLTLALGIGANTVVFSMVNALLLHPYHFRDLDSLVILWENRGTDEGFDSRWISAGDLADITANSSALQEIAAYQCVHFNLSSEGRLDVIRGCRTSGNFFQVLGVNPAQGRAFSKDDVRPGSDDVVIVSHTFWQTKSGGDPNFLGKKIRLSGRNYTVIGIMPRDFDYPVPMQLWVPLALSPAEMADRSDLSLAALGRLRDGVTIPQARAELAAFSRRLAELFPKTNAGRFLSALQLRKELYLYTLPLFLLMQAAAVFVLLLACANLANLLFARMLGRQRELAVRSSLGADRIRLARLLAAEILLLTALGGATTIAASFWGVRALRDSISPEWTKWVPGWDGIQVNPNVLLCAVLLSTALALLFGVVTALYLRRVDLNQVLKETGRAVTPSRGRLRNALVSAQITFALMLLVCAGLTIQGFHRLAGAYQGFQPDHVLKFEVGLPDGTYPDGLQAGNFFQTALRAVSNLPGVSSAALASNLPASNVESEKTLFTIEGRPAASASEASAADLQIISGTYFEVLQIPIVAGRFFSDSDTAAAARVVIINRSLARQFSFSGGALGKRFKLGAPDSAEPWATVVGIVGDARQNWWQSAALPVIYQPFLQSSKRQLDFVMRVDAHPGGYASAVPSLFSQLNPEIAVTEMNSLQTEVDDSIAIVHILGILMGIFGLIALLLSSIGLYGILSENVMRRTHEFGIRLALGAHPRDVVCLVLRHALILAGLGIAIGLPVAFAVSRAMAALVFGLVAVNLPLLLGLALLLVAVALVAAYLPARRGFHVEPETALRYE